MSVPLRHPFAFDPTYGLDLSALLAVPVPAAPLDFDAFWRARYLRARARDPRPRLKRQDLVHPAWTVHDIAYTSTGDFPIGGWLLLPRSGVVRRGLVVGHGYGGRDQPDLDLPLTDTAVLFPCCRGLSRSQRPPLSPDPAWHVLHDIDRRDAYVIGGCVEDLWVGASVLTTLYPWLEGHLGYAGISFGGGVGALALAWDDRFDRGHLALPTFGNQPLRLTLPTTGSAAAVQAYERRTGHALDTLRYYDAASAALRIKQPMLVAAALFDPAVAPPCQFSIYNALKGRKEIFILDAGHFEYPGEAEQKARLLERLRVFFHAP
ncbi:acetylxylan esterase [Pararhodospirillum oryzae]|uniref:Deacetylase n=1 Tax=Pararhodospirillum oryzae TaxID=478448 RepID=A0A512H9I3_9PROT|nr:acetylxylan esterase [Pararhodospirillum oryzae]GEO82117.1 deacetylase [Pararhodospirillum oryzae]